MAAASRRKQAERAHRLLHAAIEQYNSGLAFAARGQPVAAEAAYRRAIELKPDFAEAHFYLGALCQQQRRWHEAEAAYRQGLELQPEVAEGWNNLAGVLQEQGRLGEAANHYRRAIEFKPDLAEAHNNLGLVCQAEGRIDEALAHHEQALRFDPDNALYWGFYSEGLSRGKGAERVDEEKLVAALTRKEVDPDKVAGIAAERVCLHPVAREAVLLAQDPATGALMEERLASGKVAALMELPLLNALLQEAIVPNHRLERLLVALRSALLLSVSRGQALDPGSERFVASLALQCFANEYVYPESAGERAIVDALASKQPSLSVQELLILGCYRPLHTVVQQPPECGEPHVREVLKRQISEPLLEQQLKRTIAPLTGISEGVSSAVREQYEQNPYPRWRREGTPGEGDRVHAVLQKLFPRQAISSDSPQSPEILVAGCGTGAHSVQVARHFTNARILAIDLSLSSLAYAKRVTEEIGIRNVEYRQADILQLADWERRFDVIESCGVLHHLSDPLSGWRILTRLLRPRGYMKIGLYSRRARRDIAAARELIAARGYPATPEGIRRCRAEMAAPGSPFADSPVLASADFFSTSACRDLLFHVEEHAFSPLEIGRHLNELGLSLLGFELHDPLAQARYEARFPDDPAGVSLANWEAFEEDHPTTFIRLYEFWARR